MHAGIGLLVLFLQCRAHTGNHRGIFGHIAAQRQARKVFERKQSFNSGTIYEDFNGRREKYQPNPRPCSSKSSTAPGSTAINPNDLKALLLLDKPKDASRKPIRLLCMSYTFSKKRTNAKAQAQTWMHKCDDYFFASDEDVEEDAEWDDP